MIRKGKLVCSLVVSKENATTVANKATRSRTAEHQEAEHTRAETMETRMQMPMLNVIVVMKKGIASLIVPNQRRKQRRQMRLWKRKEKCL